MSIQHERAALAFILAAGQDHAGLTEDHFEDSHNRAIFRRCQALRAAGRPGDLAEIGSEPPEGVSASYVSGLIDGVPWIVDHFAGYVRGLVEALAARRAIAALQGKPIQIERAREILAGVEVEPIAEPIEPHTIAGSLDRFRDYLERRRASELWGHRIKCFPRLTSALFGLREITVISGKPKCNKSTLALQIASDLHSQGVPVLYFDYENGVHNLMAREAGRIGRVTPAELYSSTPWENTIGAEARLENYKNFAIIQDRTLTSGKIRAYIAEMKRRSGRDDILIVIDSLQKLPMQDLRERRAAVDQWLRDIESIKADHPALSIVLISEVSRASDAPKESSGVEYAAHFWLELRRPGELQNGEKKKGKAVPYNRDDGTREIILRAGRDVPEAEPIEYKVNFKYWEFVEEKAFGAG